MRRHFLAAFVLVPATALLLAQAGLFTSAAPAAAQNVPSPVSPRAKPCDERCSPAWIDANLRLDQLQMIGTAESYKQRPTKSLLRLIRMGGRKQAEALDFGMPSLSAQLDADVRSLSFDVAYDPKGGAYKNPAAASMAMELLPDDYIKTMARPGFKTVHVLDVDYASSCLALADCLTEVSAWSKAHPRHLPIVITLRTNDGKTPMPGATTPLACDETALNALETEIKTIFASDRLFTPDQLQGHYASLHEAATAHAWPKLGSLRGKVIFVLADTPAKTRAYQGARKSLEGRLMFVTAEETSPLAAFLAVNDPVKNAARIREAAKAGLMVITRADDETREARANDTARRDAAFASGAQIVQTDFVTPDAAISPYHVSLADNEAAMCAPNGVKTGAERCLRLESAPAALRTAAAVAP